MEDEQKPQPSTGGAGAIDNGDNGAFQEPPFESGFPIDPDDVDEGYKVPAETLSEWIGAEIGTEGYQLGVLAVKQQIERIAWDKGLGVFVVQQKHALLVAPQADTPGIAKNYQNRYIKGFVKTTQVLTLADDKALDEEARRQKYHLLRISEVVVRAARDERRKIRGEEKRRLTDGA